MNHLKHPHRESSMSDKRRLQFDFSPKSVEQLDAMVVALGAASRAEALRKALDFLILTLDAQKKGGGLLIQEGPNEPMKAIHIL
ncbi:MAG: hypothetical protein V1848_01355 [Candidatus Magasanikbacteria bacterium]